MPLFSPSSVDDLQISCYRLMCSIYSLGTVKTPHVDKWVETSGSKKVPLTICFYVGFDCRVNIIHYYSWWASYNNLNIFKIQHLQSLNPIRTLPREEKCTLKAWIWYFIKMLCYLSLLQTAASSWRVSGPLSSSYAGGLPWAIAEWVQHVFCIYHQDSQRENQWVLLPCFPPQHNIVRELVDNKLFP